MIQNENAIWVVVQMYCPNCGTLSAGYKREDGKQYFQCKKCDLVMVRTYKNRRHDTIELTIPKGIERVSR